MSRAKRPTGDEGAAERAASAVQQEQPTALAKVPERPALAPDVQPVGEMQGTGFKDRQWLIQRHGQFIQVSELLYRIVEQTNGERTLEEVAANVTEATEWLVSADNVRQLIQNKLIPLGLIASTDDTRSLTSGVTVEKGLTRSPLALNLRMRVIGPGVIDPITRVLRFLYAPPVLVPVLVAIAVAHGWLYLVHGVARTFLEVLRTPGLLLVSLAIVLASGVFHEFGHAAALRYGGGKVRAMGAGIYLIYPAFYTDVTDGYRLSRWAKVRTSLGGFYFHLIFALGLIALYLVTGQEFLLFAVMVINLDIVYQCLPFVRFDGYWALADLTGVPDFFSQMGPFLKSSLPLPAWKGNRMPNLKPWVKAVFVVYAVLAIPVLAFLMSLFVRRVPSLLAMLWDSFLSQVAHFSSAWSNGDLLGVAAAFSQALILYLEMLAVAYLAYILCRSLVRVIWNWSKPTPIRRVTGALIAVGAVVLMAYLWAPDRLP